MTPKQRADLERRLGALVRVLGEKKPRGVEPGRRAAGDATDEDEAALTEMLQSIASNRNRNDATLLGRVQRALGKLRQSPDELGVCEECGEDLPFGRLQAMPYAELCVECQNQRDPQRGARRRNLTDYGS